MQETKPFFLPFFRFEGHNVQTHSRRHQKIISWLNKRENRRLRHEAKKRGER